MITCGCGNEIHAERFELGYKVCLNCGDNGALKNKKYGSMIYINKTSGELKITNKNIYNIYKKVTSRRGKMSNMGSACLHTTMIVKYQ